MSSGQFLDRFNVVSSGWDSGRVNGASSRQHLNGFGGSMGIKLLPSL